MQIVFKSIIVFFLLLVATTVMLDVFKMEFGTVNYFERHGIFFLIFITFFPRLTLLFSSVPFGGFFWWLGFIFCPRILVASLATITYFHTNPFLVTMSWVIALGGEVLEKLGLTAPKGRFVFRTYRYGSPGPFQEGLRPHTVIKKDDAIEAEFKKHS